MRNLDRVDAARIVHEQRVLFRWCEVGDYLLEAAIDRSEIGADAIDREVAGEHAALDPECLNGLQYDAATAPVNDIVGATPQESVTLITCGGVFNPVTHQYDKRLVVRAERIKDGTAPSLPLPGT